MLTTMLAPIIKSLALLEVAGYVALVEPLPVAAAATSKRAYAVQSAVFHDANVGSCCGTFEFH
jgi:hypothetical protein